MKIEKVTFERTYNLGNYENLRVGLEAQLNEGETAANLISALERYCDSWFAETHKPKGQNKQAENQQKQKPDDSAEILQQFPEQLRQFLSWKDGKIYSQYVSRDIWEQINACARELGYRYFSDEKERYWRKAT